MEKTDRKKICVLIIDDDENVLIAIRDTFTALYLNDSCKLTIEANAENGLKLVKNGFYDLIFCDFVFYGATINGLEIFEEIKKTYHDRVYVGILIVGAGTAGIFSYNQAAGLIADCIEKPFEFTNLKGKISSAMALLTRRQEADK